MQRKRPLHGKIFARCIPKRLFAGLFGCMARISCQSQLISDAWRANLAANWRFSRPRPLLGYMRRKTCHGKTPGNASRENIATASQAKGASVRSPATVGRWGTHFASILPSSSARERTVAEYCHYQSPESAFAKMLPWTSAWIRPAPNNCRPPRKKTAPKAGLGERPRQKHERQSASTAGASSGYGAARRHRRTLGNAAQRNIAMADNAPRDKRRRAFCSPSFAVLFTARVAIGAFAVGSRRHLAVSLIETHIW